MRYEWEHGEWTGQEYYEARVEGNLLCVFRNKLDPPHGEWLGMINSRLIFDKTRNDGQRREQGLPECAGVAELRGLYPLMGETPEYMMRKVEWCYEHGNDEVER